MSTPFTMTAPSWQDPRHPDHYHWMTSRLDARGARVATSRFITAWLTLGGITPALIMFAATGSDQWALRTTGVGVTLVSVLLGSLWMRGSWPTRFQSTCCVVFGTLLAVTMCLLFPRPLLGLMSAAVFTVVATYATVFHGGRHLIFVLTSAFGVIIVCAFRVAAFDVALATGLGMLIALCIAFTTFVARALIGLIDADMFTGEIEPITGLLSREGFEDGLGITIAARGRTDDRFLVFALIDLDSFGAVVELAGPGRARQLRVLIGQMLRDKARRDNVIAHLPDSRFLLADVFNTPDPDPLCDRISSGVRSVAHELTASIGVVVTPLSPLTSMSPTELTAALLDVAENAMTEARSKGGNQYRIVYLPETPERAGAGDTPE